MNLSGAKYLLSLSTAMQGIVPRGSRITSTARAKSVCSFGESPTSARVLAHRAADFHSGLSTPAAS